MLIAEGVGGNAAAAARVPPGCYCQWSNSRHSKQTHGIHMAFEAVRNSCDYAIAAPLVVKV